MNDQEREIAELRVRVEKLEAFVEFLDAGLMHTLGAVHVLLGAIDVPDGTAQADLEALFNEERERLTLALDSWRILAGLSGVTVEDAHDED